MPTMASPSILNTEIRPPGGQCVDSPVPEFSKIRRWNSKEFSLGGLVDVPPLDCGNSNSAKVH